MKLRNEDLDFAEERLLPHLMGLRLRLMTGRHQAP